MNNKLPAGILFDLDGVLIDTETQYTLFWDKMAKQYNVADKDFSRKIKGTNLEHILNTYFADKSCHKHIIDMLSDFQENMTYQLLPGVEAFIKQIEDADVPMCIVTSSDNKKMESLFKQLPFIKLHFPNIITGDQVTHGKPHPECFMKGAEKIGCDIHECVIFEDSPNGIKAGLASGAKVIALSTTLPASVLQKFTDIIIPGFDKFSFSDIESVIANK